MILYNFVLYPCLFYRIVLQFKEIKGEEVKYSYAVPFVRYVRQALYLTYFYKVACAVKINKRTKADGTIVTKTTYPQERISNKQINKY